MIPVLTSLLAAMELKYFFNLFRGQHGVNKSLKLTSLMSRLFEELYKICFFNFVLI